MYETLAKGEIGLIISGYMNVHPLGRAYEYQTNIYSDEFLPGLEKLTKIIHENEGKIVFQIAHAGMQTKKKVINESPIAPSGKIRNPTTLEKALKASEEQIEEIIDSFCTAALRCISAGADGIQLHVAHTYLLSQFLSPFFNLRDDKWGGSDEKRFRILKEIISRIKKDLPKDKLFLVKFNVEDHINGGVHPPLAAKYGKWMKELGVDGLEVSGGSGMFSFMNMCRGKVPAEEIIEFLEAWKKPIAKSMFKKLKGKFEFDFPYNVSDSELIRKELGDFPLILVGGMRKVADMESIISKNQADFVSLSRPFIREPNLVKNIRKGASEVSCISCNRCLAAIESDLPTTCYVNKFPSKEEGKNLREKII
jgi:2,4-dienoyl-CoA reductase-like NADH-dependent reductase (Old Yellow Enzyme family)